MTYLKIYKLHVKCPRYNEHVTYFVSARKDNDTGAYRRGLTPSLPIVTYVIDGQMLRQLDWNPLDGDFPALTAVVPAARAGRISR